jgi:hypothetical protein
VGQPPETRDVSERLHLLLKLEMAKILLHDIRHGHAQPGREILCRHHLLLLGILQQVDEALGETLSVSRRIKLDGQFLVLPHLPEVRQVSADDRHTISAGQVSNAAAPRGRGIGHDRNGRALK